MTPPRHLLIMGPGRSGSTALQVVLGQHPAVLTTGEPGWFPRDGVQRDRACTCGETAWHCPQWSPIIGQLSRPGWDALAAASVAVHRHHNLDRVLAGTLAGAEGYARHHLQVLDALAADAGAAWTVDGTKYAARAWLLARLAPERVHVLWLTRSVDGLIASFGRPGLREEQPYRPPAWVLAYDAVVSRSCARVAPGLPSLHRLRYEHLVDAPADALSALGAWLGLDPAPWIAALRHERLELGHLLTAAGMPGMMNRKIIETPCSVRSRL